MTLLTLTEINGISCSLLGGRTAGIFYAKQEFDKGLRVTQKQIK